MYFEIILIKYAFVVPALIVLYLEKKTAILKKIIVIPTGVTTEEMIYMLLIGSMGWLENATFYCQTSNHYYEMNFTLCVLLVYNDNGSVQTLCITRVSALCTKCLHRPIVIINQQYTKGEIHFIYLHYFHVFGFCFINRYHGNCCVSLENPTVCTINGRA